MNNTLSKDEKLILSAEPYADQCVDIPHFSKICADKLFTQSEAAIFIKLQAADTRRFPVGIVVWTLKKGPEGITREVLHSQELTRPEYQDNPDGFRGNHLIAMLLRKIRKTMEELTTPLPLKVFTSEAAWIQHCTQEEYIAAKEYRLLDKIVDPNQAVQKNTKRLRI